MELFTYYIIKRIPVLDEECDDLSRAACDVSTHIQNEVMTMQAGGYTTYMHT